jgi:Major Facilitator Superfamily.
MKTTASAARPLAPSPDAWRRNVLAVTAASFMGYTGFTLVMPFLPLFIGQLGVTDVGSIAMWTGLSLGITPALTALLSPAWGRLGDRYGRKIMVERSMISFVVLMTAMAFVTRAWHVLACAPCRACSPDTGRCRSRWRRSRRRAIGCRTRLAWFRRRSA